MNYFILTQIFGFIVFIFESLTLASKDKKKILKYNTFSNGFYLLEYLSAHAYTGAISILVTFLRNYLFEKYNRKGKRAPVYILLILLVLLIIINYTTYDGLISIIPAITVGLFTFSLWQNSIKNFKLLNMFIAFLSAVYNLYYKAYTGFASQIIFIIICMFTYDNKSKKKKTKKRR